MTVRAIVTPAPQIHVRAQPTSVPIVLRAAPFSRSLEDLVDIETINKTDTASVFYDSSSEKFQIRPIEATDVSFTLDVDGGFF